MNNDIRFLLGAGAVGLIMLILWRIGFELGRIDERQNRTEPQDTHKSGTHEYLLVGGEAYHAALSAARRRALEEAARHFATMRSAAAPKPCIVTIGEVAEELRALSSREEESNG